jgi:dTDP-4-amino-4,6-dideoxygalactose transaminase
MPESLPFALPDIGEDEINEVVDSLKTGWLTTGPKTKRFEEEFAAFVGKDIKAIAVNSATAGLHLALEAVGVGPGDEVITTPYTFTATAEVIRYLGADPVFVDIKPETLNIDPSRIVTAITSKTKAIIPVHFGGLPCDMKAILRIAHSNGLKIIEDAAHAFPATYEKKLIGTLDSDAAVFSFYATKTITTGEGGMITTRNNDLADRCKVMRLHGISNDVFDRYNSSKPSWYYEVIAPGYKYNMTDLVAAIGIHQLKKAWFFQKRRTEIAERYDVELRDLPIISPPKALNDDVHAWHLYVIRLNKNTDIRREAFIEKMVAKGIGCSVHFIPLHIHPYWRTMYKLKPQDFPQALAAYERAVSLPIYTKMTDDDQLHVIDAIKQILQ